jgi:hydrogenase expression/formation protein HypD
VKYVAEFRDRDSSLRLAEQIHATVTRPWRIMEICGGQTHSILRSGIPQLLPPSLELIHGPGCPVCVTPEQRIDEAIAVAHQPDRVLCSFGDMLRVPGTSQSLLEARALGAHVQMVTSPLDAVELAKQHPDKQFVFFAVGFETTAPATAVALKHARAAALPNFQVLIAHVRVPPALEVLLGDPDCAVNGLLAAGHVCSVMGTSEYEPLAERFGLPIAVTGFEPVDILQGVLACVKMLEQGQHRVENHYARVVREQGNPVARALVDEVFEVTDLPWRGFGTIPCGGLRLGPAYAQFEAKPTLPALVRAQPSRLVCQSALVLAGRIRPPQCPAFGKQCTPSTPLGAPMVSSEGACAAYFRHAPMTQMAEP